MIIEHTWLCMIFLYETQTKNINPIHPWKPKAIGPRPYTHIPVGTYEWTNNKQQNLASVPVIVPKGKKAIAAIFLSMESHCRWWAKKSTSMIVRDCKAVCVWRMLVLHSAPFSSKNLTMWSGGIHSAPAFTPLWLALCGFDASWRMLVCVSRWKDRDGYNIDLPLCSLTHTHTRTLPTGIRAVPTPVRTSHRHHRLPPHTNNGGREKEREMEGVGVHPAQLYQWSCHNHTAALFLTAISFQLPTLKRSASRSVRVNNLDLWFWADSRWERETIAPLRQFNAP